MPLRKLHPMAILVTVLLTGASCVVPQDQPATREKVKAKAEKAQVLQSKNWNVVVDSAVRWEKWSEGKTPQFASDKNMLEVGLMIEYVGPDADVPPPAMTVVNENGDEFRNFGNLKAEETIGSIEFLDWLLDATYPLGSAQRAAKRHLKTGEKLSSRPLYFYVLVPRQSKELRVAFGDTVPVLLKTRAP